MMKTLVEIVFWWIGQAWRIYDEDGWLGTVREEESKGRASD